MKSCDIILNLMEKENISYKQLAEYSGLGSRQNVYQMLQRDDMRVDTFVKMLECLGCVLKVVDTETGDEEDVY